MTGQVAYHLLSAAHAARAPWPVVVLVSSLPVVVLGFGAALSHLLRGEDDEPETRPEYASESGPELNPEAVPGAAPKSGESEPEPEPVDAPARAPRTPVRSAPRTAKPGNRRVKPVDPAQFYAAELAAGKLPSIRQLKADLHVGQERGKSIRAELEALLVERVPMAA